MKSSTYRVFYCAEAPCRAVNSGCTGTCKYRVDYVDKSYSSGNFASETETTKEKFYTRENISTSSIITNDNGFVNIKDLWFGCGYENKSTFEEEGSGMVGLGAGPACFPSLISQLGGTFGKKFSYFLTFKDTSPLILGNLTPNRLQSSAMPNFRTFHILDLEDISVGEKRLGIPPGTFDPLDPKKSFTIDSGAVMTYLPAVAYNKLVSSLDDSISLPRTYDPTQPNQVCYLLKNEEDFDEIPNVTFH
ncbi:hypothetical protein AMTR_s00057p00164130 [Amborella trichopoda]|uniref:Peptidase A1 domain-containing protein n=2 Tax=Amborella trichopoda TaxID=13333 RepID=U5D3S1_AMBTC|nr:hypothetical protein AMTR_s00057p00164130 [Amborella trichopoda]